MLTFKGECNIIINALYFAFKLLVVFIPMKVIFNVRFLLRRESNFMRSLLKVRGERM